MSLSTTASADFDAWDDDLAFEAITQHYDDEPVRRLDRWTSKRVAIDEGLGFRRRRTHEREA